MSYLTSLFAACSAVILSIVPAVFDGEQDCISLKSGGVIDGAIVDENPQSVTVEVSPGARIEVARADIINIRRATKTAAATTKPANPKINFQESWWIVRDARGAAVGTRHFLARPDRDRPELYNLEEILELKDDGGANIVISRMETFDAAMAPVECYYREVFEGGSSTVRAVVEGEELAVEYIDSLGRTRDRLTFTKGTVFSLMFEARAAAAKLAPGAQIEGEVFDPFIRNITKRTVRAGEPRLAAKENETPTRRETLVFKNRGVESVYWLSNAHEIDRYELNGPDLFAVRTTRQLAEASLATAAEASWVVRDSTGRLRVLLPNANWKVDRMADDLLSLQRKDGRACVLVCISEGEAGSTLTSSATDLERRLRATLAEFKRSKTHEITKVGHSQGDRFRFQFESEGRVQEGVAVVTLLNNKVCSMTLSCDPKELDGAETEFERLIQRLDVLF